MIIVIGIRRRDSDHEMPLAVWHGAGHSASHGVSVISGSESPQSGTCRVELQLEMNNRTAHTHTSESALRLVTAARLHFENRRSAAGVSVPPPSPRSACACLVRVRADGRARSPGPGRQAGGPARHRQPRVWSARASQGRG